MTTSIVYPYYAAAAHGDELRLSLRSLAENLRGNYEPVVVGDIPDWYTGGAIELPRVTQEAYRVATGKTFDDRWHPWVDTTWKYAAVAQCVAISNEFLIWYDDTFVLSTMHADELLIPRCRGEIPSAMRRKNEYWDALMRTRKRLLQRGRPIRDFDTHFPIPASKADMPAYYEEFQPLVSPSCFASQYHNWRGSEFREIELPREFDYVNRRRCETHDVHTSAPIVNYGIVTPQIERMLQTRFSSPSPWERTTKE